ncbi:MAG: membrane-bound PQQ-dependent dehydrogenase, glucose/quinate/shikimate family [Rudaea sp.]|uniref:membrane-bound PQQ-dependent dehydrogenase, glucose/quinate/shikimate family n=1 Tax=Rudaea sp. TaxID=2136325 RepID=UPI0039E379B9
MNGSTKRKAGGWFVSLYAIVLVLVGLALLAGGVVLAGLGGSWYYLIAGALLVVSGVWIYRRNFAGVWLFALGFLGTLAWAYWEVGAQFWPLVPRLSPWIVLGLVLALIVPTLRRSARAEGWLAAVVLAAVGAVGFAQMFSEHGTIEATRPLAAVPVADAQAQRNENWQYYGRTLDGHRFAPFDQIDKQNIDKLQIAWTFRTGDIPGKGAEEQTTPTQIGDSVYVCTPYGKVFSLDADTGKQRWRFDSKEPDSKVWNRCRGVAYYDAKAYAQTHPDEEKTQAAASAGTCAQRLFLGTTDARLIALDSATGQPCPGFGDNGTVDLKVGMGLVQPFYYMTTSENTVIGNRILVGGWVQDGASVDEPSGVIRAFSADTGELLWAWDPDNPNITLLPPPGETYSRTTPNMWSTPAYDEKLDWAFLPMGGQTPDFFGGFRRPGSDEFGSSVVAIDMKTGKVQWHFQTTHHDLWDYDVPSQPALVDMPDQTGKTVPAVVQLTKRGQIFALDRTTGKPIAEVVEKPAPTNVVKGDRVSPTQPYSVGMPQVGNEPLTEKDMWGATFFDQLYCRIEFKRMRFDGEFTLASEDKINLQYPGNYGGFNWGSAAVDAQNDILYAGSMRMPLWGQYVSRAFADDPNAPGGHDGLHVMAGTPFGYKKGMFMSPLGVPCHAPPYGQLTAVDLKNKKILWQKPMGTVADTVLPFGFKAKLPFAIGMPVMGGPVATASGLVFFAGTYDYYLRAIDSATGKELWKGRLPVGAQATPMTYVSPQSGRQYVVIAAGGARQSPDRGDYIVAFALPDR